MFLNPPIPPCVHFFDSATIPSRVCVFCIEAICVTNIMSLSIKFIHIEKKIQFWNTSKRT